MSRPLPVPDETSADYWLAAARHVLTLPRCAQCRAFSLPPEVICPHCHSTQPAFRFEPVSGRGTVRTWTVIRQSFLAGFEVPFVLVDVQLDEHPHIRMLGRLLDGPQESIALGDAVTVAFEDLGPDCAVPAFRLVNSL